MGLKSEGEVDPHPGCVFFIQSQLFLMRKKSEKPKRDWDWLEKQGEKRKERVLSQTPSVFCEVLGSNFDEPVLSRATRGINIITDVNVSCYKENARNILGNLRGLGTQISNKRSLSK